MHVPQTYFDICRRLDQPAESPVRPVEDFELAYPPVGFAPCLGGIGNGDEYGFYWPVGREADPPVVAFMSHDAWALIPVASSIEGLDALGEHSELAFMLGRPDPLDEENEDDEVVRDFAGSVAWRLALDPGSPYLQVANADVAVARNELDRAETLYRQAVERLPEYTAAHYGLAVLSRRQRKPSEVVRWCLEAVRSPLAFRGASFWADTALPPEYVNRDDYRRKCLHWLQQAKPTDADDFESDPLFRERHRLTFATGVATNDDFLIYQDAVAEYLTLGQPLIAVRLTMLYGELMAAEVTPFQERCGFTFDGHRDRLAKLFEDAGLTERLAFLQTS